MSITINSNILSLNAQRRLGQHTNDLRSSFEKLSSGLRVSKASDDAAGLSISETLKLDTKLSSQALRNVNDGISMISIISGALDSQKSILFRMAELSEQSANGVNSGKQREALQKEYSSLLDEFDRVASSAKFNGISLLRNSDPNTISLMAGITGANTSLLSVAAANSHRFAGMVTQKSDLNENGLVQGNDVTLFVGSGYFNPLSVSLQTGGLNNFASKEEFQDSAFIYFTDSLGRESSAYFVITRILNDSITFSKYSGSATIADVANRQDLFAAATNSAGETASISSQIATVGDVPKSLTLNFTFSGSGATASLTIDLSSTEFESYDTGRSSQKPSAIGFTNILSQNSAKRATNVVKNRIDDLSKLQGSFGAIESRLTFAANKLQVDRENFQSAASQITDVDVATESSNLTKTQILQQAAVSVLAQANQQPQIALQLLGSFRR